MSDEDEGAEDTERSGNLIGAGVGAGALVGAALGLATGSFGLYLPFGLAGGLALGLADLGCRFQIVELTAALRIALETPAAAARWLAGEDLFASAEVVPEHRQARSFRV